MSKFICRYFSVILMKIWEIHAMFQKRENESSTDNSSLITRDVNDNLILSTISYTYNHISCD